MNEIFIKITRKYPEENETIYEKFLDSWYVKDIDDNVCRKYGSKVGFYVDTQLFLRQIT